MLKDFFHKKRHYATIGTSTPEPKTTPSDQKDNIPKGLVNKCKSCNALLMSRELQKHLFTCPHCGYHFPIDARTRIEMLVDENHFFEYDSGLYSIDPLEFPNYPEKLKQAQATSDLLEGVVTGEGTIEGQPVVLGVMDSRFMMGSMGSAMGEKLTRAMEAAAAKRYPLILLTASGGARMQEGILSLMQMAKTSAALERLHERKILFVSVVTHPTTGGVSASFASLGDIILAEPGAMFGFAGRRVIEQTIRQKLPDDFQTAEFVLKHGMIDEVVPRKQLRDTLAVILRIHSRQGWAHHG